MLKYIGGVVSFNIQNACLFSFDLAFFIVKREKRYDFFPSFWRRLCMISTLEEVVGLHLLPQRLLKMQMP